MMPLSQVFPPPSVQAATKRYRAVWNDAVLADGTDTVVLDGNPYFRLADVRTKHLRSSDRHLTGPWKGLAIYYDIVVGDRVNPDAARYYPNPSPTADRIRGRVAFSHDVKVEAVEE
jgi:uncharacterized protein (DUF427 family)